MSNRNKIVQMSEEFDISFNTTVLLLVILQIVSVTVLATIIDYMFF